MVRWHPEVSTAMGLAERRQRRGGGVVLLLVLAVALLLAGCNRYSRVRLASGDEQRMMLTYGDATHIHGIDKETGEPVSVARRDVAEVTYPGNVAVPIFGSIAGLGLLIAGIGGVFLTLPENSGTRAAAGALMFSGGGIALGGLGPLFWYAFQARSARQVVDEQLGDPAAAPAPAAALSVAPMLVPVDDVVHGGIVLGARW